MFQRLGPMEVEDQLIDKTLMEMEKNRKENVQKRMEQHVKRLEQFNEMIVMEAEEELKLIRHKHLVTTLQRLQSYKAECDDLIAGINRQEDEMELKGRSYQDKLNEIERSIRKAVEEATKEASISSNNSYNISTSVNGNDKPVESSEPRDAALSSTARDSKTAEKMVTAIGNESMGSTVEAIETDDPRTPNRNDRKVVSEGSAASKDLTVSAEAAAFTEYVQLQKFCIDFENGLQKFNADDKLKGYRNDLKLFIRTLINTIAKNSIEELRYKASQMSRLFSKQSVNYQNSHLDCNSHPDALNFCLSFTAQTFVAAIVRQASSGNPAATAFPIGAFISMIWSRFEVFGKLFLGSLHEKCPFVIPYYPTKEPGESEMNHLITCGYCISKEGELESEESYLKRMKAMVSIYGIIVQSTLKNHPRGLSHGWNWLANMLRLDPRPMITAGVLHAFLQTSSYKFYSLYGKQFIKILHFIETLYVPKIAGVTDKTVTRSTLVSLEVFVKESADKIRKNRYLEEPVGHIRVIPANF